MRLACHEKLKSSKIFVYLNSLMIRLIHILFFISCFLVFPSASFAAVDSLSNDRYTLYYYQDRIDIQENYLDNERQIARIKDILARSPRIDSIAVYAYASPEGSPVRNQWLSQKRAEAARKFILSNLPHDSVLCHEDIILHPMGENWDGLIEELESNYHLQNRDRVMKILHANISTETKKWRLQNLDNGYTYRHIIRHHMPALRMATWVCVYVPIPEENPKREISLNAQSAEIPELEVPELKIPQLALNLTSGSGIIDVEKKTILAVKTNMLYDALTLANYSIEVPFNERFSALWYHQFPWWRWGKADNQYCVRFLSIGGEARWWFKPQPRLQNGKSIQRDRLMGHFVGVYAESGKWDFEFGRSVCHQGEHWSAGLSYGYSMPLGRRFNIEFSVSVGYASIAYRKFAPSEDYEILWRDPVKHGRWNYFGPTKLQVSLVYPILITYKKKGGRQ